MSSEALREAFVWLEAIASADPKLVRPSGLAAALLAEVARLEQERRDLKLWNTRVVEQLAVAREREQRAVKTLKKYGSHSESCKRYQHDWRIRFRNAEPTCLCGFRAALVDEPAAATLAEPDQGTGPGGSAQPSRRQSGANIPSGSASAAADEPGETPA